MRQHSPPSSLFCGQILQTCTFGTNVPHHAKGVGGRHSRNLVSMKRRNWRDLFQFMLDMDISGNIFTILDTRTFFSVFITVFDLSLGQLLISRYLNPS